MIKRLTAIVLMVVIVLHCSTAQAAYDPKTMYNITWLWEKNGKTFFMTQEEFDLLCHTVYCEAGNQPEEAQRLCAIVILNRWAAADFPDDIRSVIYDGNGTQFNVVRWAGFPEAWPYPAKTEIACYRAIAEYPQEPTDLLAFRSNYHFSWGTPWPHTDDQGIMYFTRIERR